MTTLGEQYSADGVVRVERLLDEKEMCELEAALERYTRDVLPTIPLADYVLEADGTSIRNQWRMEKYDSYFEHLSEKEKITKIVTSLLHGPAICKGVETFNKAATSGSGVPPHQDNAYFCATPPDMLTVWIAIDPVTEKNGPVCYLKGSHREGMRPHKKSEVAGNSMIMINVPDHTEYDQYRGILSPGDAVVHHCQTIHWSAPNNTSNARRGLLLVYQGLGVRTDRRLAEAYHNDEATIE